MVDLKTIKNIYLYAEPINFRCGINSLSNLILTQFNENEVDGYLFVFFSKNKKQIKAIEFNENGIWLYQNKLFEGNFLLPSFNDSDKLIIDKRQLKAILNSLEIKSKKDKKS